MLTSLNWTTSGNIESGDYSPGQGITTGNRTMGQAVIADKGQIAGTQLFPKMAVHPIGGNAVTWWVALVALYLIWRYFTSGLEDKMKLWEIFNTTLEAVIGLSFMHWFFQMYQVPGLTPVIQSA